MTCIVVKGRRDLLLAAALAAAGLALLAILVPGLKVHGAPDLFGQGQAIAPEVVEGLAVADVLLARYDAAADVTHVLLQCSDWVCEEGVVPVAFSLAGDHRGLTAAGSVLLRPVGPPAVLTTKALDPPMTWLSPGGAVVEVAEVVLQPFEVAPREPYRWGAAAGAALLGSAALVAARQGDARLAGPIGAALLGALAVGASLSWLLVWILYVVPAAAGALAVMGLLSLRWPALRYPLFPVAVAVACSGLPMLLVQKLYPMTGSIL